MAGFAQAFETVHQEVQKVPLQVQGEIPAWLNGDFLRTGPGRFEVGGVSYNHWFDGLAMLTKIHMEAGAAHYSNRFLRSKNYFAVRKSGRFEYGQWATAPHHSLLDKLIETFDFNLQFGNNTMVNVGRIGGQMVALTTTPFPERFDLETLEARGALKFDDMVMSMLGCPHPQYDQQRREYVDFCSFVFPGLSCYQVYTIPFDSTRRKVLTRVWRSKPALMHTFAMTPNTIVLLEYPFRIDPLALMTMDLREIPFIANYKWLPGEGMRFIVIDRDSGEVLGEHATEAFFAFHHVNAWEDGGDIVIDLPSYGSPSPIDHIYLGALRSPGGGVMPASPIRRYRIPREGNADVPSYEMRSTPSIEMPWINNHYIGADYRYVYGYGFIEPGNFYDCIVKVDTANDDVGNNHVQWREPSMFPSEPIMLGRPGATEEDDGVVFSVVLDAKNAGSVLVMLDAKTMTEIARAQLPHRDSLLLHGAWLDATTNMLHTSL